MPKSAAQLAPLEPLLIDTKTAAAMYSVSERTWNSWIASGQAPPSLKLGGRRLYDVAVLRRHVAAGCPPIDKFTQILKESKL